MVISIFKPLYCEFKRSYPFLLKLHCTRKLIQVFYELFRLLFTYLYINQNVNQKHKLSLHPSNETAGPSTCTTHILRSGILGTYQILYNKSDTVYPRIIVPSTLSLHQPTMSPGQQGALMFSCLRPFLWPLNYAHNKCNELNGACLEKYRSCAFITENVTFVETMLIDRLYSIAHFCKYYKQYGKSIF